MSEQDLRRSYAVSFVSYFIRHAENIRNIHSIYLYGSVAKSTSAKDSDVDIFVDLVKDSKKNQTNIRKTIKDFYASKEAIIFKLLGVKNDINVKAGMLGKWDSLRRSIMSEGVVLWGPAQPGKPSKTEHNIIFFWESIKRNRGAFLNKLYGYKSGDKRYDGFISKVGGRKLGKSCIMIPIRYREEMVHLIKKYDVNAKAFEVHI